VFPEGFGAVVRFIGFDGGKPGIHSVFHNCAV
jgi:hypothetical protein